MRESAQDGATVPAPTTPDAREATGAEAAGVSASLAETGPAVSPAGPPAPPAVAGDAGQQALAFADGRYRVDARLGSGGFGVVYKGYDEELHREVAIKVPRRDRVVGEQDLDTYLAEARVLASLDHPGIVPIYDVGRTDDGLCYLVSKFIPGSDVAARLRQGKPSAAEAAALTADVAEALHHAHHRGLVHRDIKPANILLDPGGRPVVVDFGLALREEEVGTGPTCPGTPAYMSPEQARQEGHLVDARSDVYSLGVVLYELLTGQRPFRADDHQALLEQIKTREARPPRQLDETIPRELDRICLKCLAKRAADRYSTALDLAEDLRHWLAAPPSAPAGPPSRVGAPAGPALPAGPAADSEPSRLTVVPRGLRSFDAEDADFFLRLLPGPRGRDGLPDSILFWKTRLEETDPDRTFRLGVLYGPSGCGKSSLVKAGLLPRLAGHVQAVYVEATPADTEARLLRALRRRCPGVPDGLPLVEALAHLRRGRGLPDGQKVVLVLDQFEQWLHATRGEPHPALAEALRQCDGRRVQALILVRDDFWMSTTRFMREVEVPLLEGRNSAAVDLFDLRHARKVLAGFGRAFGALPDARLAPEQERFLEQAVAQLSREGKVVPVRLSVFAEMVKGRPWTPATLKEVGGAEGIGVAFLEETFAAPAAPPEHRLHQRAARAVLRELLPEPGADIKGRMQPYHRLLAASGYARAPGDFADLLRILDTELRLVTPTEREEPAGADPGPAEPAERYYQLTHDYLVHALRQWLTAKQRETWRGRVELRLAEQAALWGVRPEKRYLPSAWEWAQALLLGRRLSWTVPQRRMMAAATRHHARRGLLAAALLLVAGLVALLIAAGVEDRRQASEAAGLLDRLRVADIDQVPEIVTALEGARARVDPGLAHIAADPRATPKERLRASLALVPVDEGQVPYLLDRLLAADPGELLVIRAALRPHGEELAGRLWQVLLDGTADPERRLRAACALAEYAPDDPRWDEAAGPVARQLVREDALLLRQWITALRPVRDHLLAPLAEVYRGQTHDPTERSLATSILADYAADRPDVLVDLVKDADVRQYAQLIGKLEAYPAEAVAGMEAELARAAPPGAPQDVKDRLAKRQATAAVTLYRLGRFEPVWPLLRYAPDPSVRNYLIHLLNPLGADPRPLAERWGAETDVSARRALLLGLGEFTGGRLPADVRDRLVPEALRAYRTDPDAGVHGAAEWMLGAWGAGDEARKAEADLRGRPAAGRSWYVNGQGHTMVVIDGRGQPDYLSARKEVDRRFAVATKEVTVEQFLRFRPGHPNVALPTSGPDYPVNVVTWYDAAAYCRWLSEQEGVAEDQMCYPPLSEIKPGMAPYPDYLHRTGYRLPTEAEWELACRAGSACSRFCGDADELLPHYAWYAANAGFRLHPVGRLKPNDLGLFDMLGNAMEWCQDANDTFLKTGADVEDPGPVRSDSFRAARGGTHHQQAPSIRSTQRDPLAPTTPWYSLSFRVARTQPPP